MKIITLLLLCSFSAYTAESIFTDAPSAFSITVPFAEDNPDTKNLEHESYRIRSYTDSERNVTVKIMLNRNGDDNLDVTMLYDATKKALGEAGLIIDAFPIPNEDSPLGKSFSALNGHMHQITYLNSQNNNILNIVISGRDLASVKSINLWLREHNK